MSSEIYYINRSKIDGRYLVAHPNPDQNTSYILLFKEYADALTYLNKYATEMASQFAVESLPNTQLRNLIQRWQFTGIAIVEDPLLPTINFVTVG